MLHIYSDPEKCQGQTEWIEWVFALRFEDRRHALEFLEDWSGLHIALMGLSQIVAATIIGLVWACRSGDVQTAFTVAGFALTVSTGM